MAQRKIRKACVLGSGVMGSGIAAHLANAGIPSIVLDIVPKDTPADAPKAKRNAIALGALKATQKAKPAAFMSPRFHDLVEVGNFDDDLHRLAECDWVIEVVIENMDIKKGLYKKVASHWKPGIIVSSNTSGLSINEMVSELSADFKKHFLGTHFFNPARYMKLLEIIPHKESDPEILAFMREFSTKVLGKGVVNAKDTPNFIANRIGIYGMSRTMHYMGVHKLTVEEVDVVTGKAMAHPNSATYRTADLVGLDTMYHVQSNIHEAVKEDECRDQMKPPAFLETIVKEKGWLGNKTKGGFYKKTKGDDGKRVVMQLDLEKMEYVPTVKPKFDSVGKAKKIDDPAQRLKTMFESDDKAAAFAWDITRDTCIYSANRIPEISDTVLECDKAMRWGFNWELGPFEGWDAIGLKASVERMEKEKVEVPKKIKEMIAAGAESFYKTDEATGAKSYWDFDKKAYVPIEADPAIILLGDLKRDKKRILDRNTDATLVDLGDGVINCEFHCKMNAVGPDLIKSLNKGMDLLESSNEWVGMTVLNHDATAYSAGANLLLVMMAAQQGQYDQVETMASELQQTVMRMKYCEKPVVTAPAGLALGGGCEIAMHGQRIVAAGETYIGLVEFGVGLVPAGGGCKEMVCRMTDGLPLGVNVDMTMIIGKAFENIAMVKVATSGEEAKDFGFLRAGIDVVALSRDHQLDAAKRMALGLATAGHNPGKPRNDVPVLGPTGASAFKLLADGMKRGGFISEHDMLIASKIAHILTGGNVAEGAKVSEQHLLDLEREAFMSLLGEEKTMDRIKHMLTTNKPLRN